MARAHHTHNHICMDHEIQNAKTKQQSTMNQEVWDKLKEHVEHQLRIANQCNTKVHQIYQHVWKDVKNKMWSLEQAHEKNEKRAKL